MGACEPETRPVLAFLPPDSFQACRPAISLTLALFTSAAVSIKENEVILDRLVHTCALLFHLHLHRSPDGGQPAWNVNKLTSLYGLKNGD